MMEEDGDDFGPLYSDILKPCSTVEKPNFFNDQKPLNCHVTSDLPANAFKDLEEYDEFLLSECGVDGGKLLSECEVQDYEFDDVIFDAEMEQEEAEIDGRGLDEDNEINVLGDMMDVDNDDLQLECLRSSTGGDDVDEEESESDKSFDIIIDDNDLNDKKFVEKKELGLLRVGSLNDLDNLDDLEPGEIPRMKAELGTDVEATVGQSNQSFHTESKGVRSVFMSQTNDDSKAEQNQVNSVHNAVYYYCGTGLRHLPVHFRRAFNLEDSYSESKPWERPGVNLSDYFNFDLDEENWQNYCKQMKQLLQNSPPSKAVGNKSEQLQSKNNPEKRTGEAIQVLISHGERVGCLQNHHQRECDSDAIIEIVFTDSADDTESFTKDLKDCALHDYKKCLTTIHKIISGDKIIPFPLDGSFHQIYHEQRVSINYAQQARNYTNFELVVSKKQDHISYKDWCMDLDHPKEKSEAEQGPREALVKYDKVMPLYSSELNKGSAVDEGDCNMRVENTLYQADLLEGNNEIKGSAVDEDNCRMRKEETLAETDHQEGNNDNKLSSVDEDNCRMRIEETFSETDQQEGNNDNKVNKERTEKLRDPINNHEQEFPGNCNLATNLGNDVVFDDQKHEAEREENVDEVQGSPRARESCNDEIMSELMSNIKSFMDEVDELVDKYKDEHLIFRWR